MGQVFHNRSREERVSATRELGDELSQVLSFGTKEKEGNRLLEVSHTEVVKIEPML